MKNNIVEKILDYKKNLEKLQGKTKPKYKKAPILGKQSVKPLDKVWDLIDSGGYAEFSYYKENNKKLQKIHVSVDNGENMFKNLPKYKFYIKNAVGFIVYFKTNDRKNAQNIVDYLYGKGMYTVCTT